MLIIVDYPLMPAGVYSVDGVIATIPNRLSAHGCFRQSTIDAVVKESSIILLHFTIEMENGRVFGKGANIKLFWFKGWRALFQVLSAFASLGKFSVGGLMYSVL